ncbi:MAG: bifunctional phosphoribosyl-AMP cyclohydrolase/phosphoribosyl-ATP diphosphatase HisIE [Blautia sp.]|nr:bifunctional phosphoribosyl-AMP cyclohydrolase/phosphoribosyl-ATP diphosphatase HisIE [Blautia sp.]
MQRLKTVPCLYICGDHSVAGFDSREATAVNAVDLVRGWNEQNADEILVFDLSKNDEEHEASILLLRRICEISECPVIAAGHIRRVEDVKKILYAGSMMAVLNFSGEDGPALLEEVSLRFGQDRIGISVSQPEQLETHEENIRRFASRIVYMGTDPAPVSGTGLHVTWYLPSVPVNDPNAPAGEALLSPEVIRTIKEYGIDGLSLAVLRAQDGPLARLREALRAEGFDTDVLKASMCFDKFKKDASGLVPVVVQDYQTDEVLMVAYMDKEAYETTLRTGRMTYYSRSRQEQWVKGLTSGHFQYVKELAVDCDRDTLLARVDQIGAACHTGNRSCFYTTLAKKEFNSTNPLRVFQDVYDVILDRKVHPKEGSYTNYLFDKGIDKILKKVGEEAAEIIIAAKNPDKEEVKYEISDFLYHVMVLMAEKGLTWEEVTRELARR